MNIEKGDKVKIIIDNQNLYFWCIGTVLTAENNNFGRQFLESGNESNWYIELTVTESSNGLTGYTYWKELPDGGVVGLLEKGAKND